jgi:hypothetical protein
VPLGYEPNGRTLTINQAEAETVRTIFRLYRDLGTVRAVKTEADRLGLTTKKRVSASGGVSGALPMSRGYLYKLLGNPLYVGRIPHKDTSYPGQHPAIIDQELWEDVQAQLADKTHARRRGKTIKAPSPLAGKLNHADGEPLTPSHAVKSGRRYRYYISRSLVSRSGEPADPTQGWRLPAGEVERITSRAVMSLLTTPAKLTDAARTAGLPSTSIAGLLHRAARWSGDPLSLVEHARIRPFAIDLTLDLGELNPDGPLSITHTIDVQLKRRGVETKLVIPTDEPSNARRTTDPALAKAITRAHRWFEALATGQATSIADVAKSENLTDRYVSRLLPLAFLAPDITEAVLDGRQPRHLTVEYLLQNIDLPIDWSEQRQLLGLA